jgi:signal transduction histidine kinase/phage shock protein PspC (stress-responsive transcriptional regulator)
MARRPTFGLPRDLRRSTEHRVLGGVCGGIGAYLGVDPVVIRLAVVVLTFVSGTGVLLYAIAWAVLPEGDVARPRASARTRRGREQPVAIAFVTVGALLLLRSMGLWFPDGLIWPVAIAAIGLGVAWARTDGRNGDASRGRGERVEDALVGATPLRIAVGAALVLAGAVTFIVTSDSFATLGAVGTAVIVTVAGAALLLGPWILRLWHELDTERRERIRQEERAEVAAHLHDSVLQTLALIQRRSGSPDETTQLARRQERELRAWLYGDRDPAQKTLAGALEAVADEVEGDHAVTVDVVTAGDCPMDDRLRAMVEAARESVVNAAKHAGVREVSVFAEVHSGSVTAYVRDRGRGFDPGSVNGDRRGIADSIRGRMERHGGTVSIWSAPGEGTEVVLEMQRAGA